ncbi:unnamed protein product [Nesidiocoris tenuis]|uniref:Uncharacterized protein n=1 Tax=Nesidiocoris tenuis TaxID=355587 RepID=A0A6H5G0Q9_9HEMI|nr:unnamed protein product [Nesidiocoris tenuis]
MFEFLPYETTSFAGPVNPCCRHRDRSHSVADENDDVPSHTVVQFDVQRIFQLLVAIASPVLLICKIRAQRSEKFVRRGTEIGGIFVICAKQWRTRTKKKTLCK